MCKNPVEKTIYPLPVDPASYLTIQSLLGLVSGKVRDSSDDSRFITNIGEKELYLTAQRLGLLHCMNIAYKNKPPVNREDSLFRIYSDIAKLVYTKQKEYWKQINAGSRPCGSDPA